MAAASSARRRCGAGTPVPVYHPPAVPRSSSAAAAPRCASPGGRRPVGLDAPRRHQRRGTRSTWARSSATASPPAWKQRRGPRVFHRLGFGQFRHRHATARRAPGPAAPRSRSGLLVLMLLFLLIIGSRASPGSGGLDALRRHQRRGTRSTGPAWRRRRGPREIHRLRLGELHHQAPRQRHGGGLQRPEAVRSRDPGPVYHPPAVPRSSSAAAAPRCASPGGRRPVGLDAPRRHQRRGTRSTWARSSATASPPAWKQRRGPREIHRLRLGEFHHQRHGISMAATSSARRRCGAGTPAGSLTRGSSRQQQRNGWLVFDYIKSVGMEEHIEKEQAWRRFRYPTNVTIAVLWSRLIRLNRRKPMLPSKQERHCNSFVRRRSYLQPIPGSSFQTSESTDSARSEQVLGGPRRNKN